PIASNWSRYLALSIAFSLGLLLRGSDRPLVPAPAKASIAIVETFGPAGKCLPDVGQGSPPGADIEKRENCGIALFLANLANDFAFPAMGTVFGHRHAL